MQWLAAAIERVAAVADASPVLSLGVLLLCGYFAGRLAGLIRLPSITGYIVAGLVLGDSVVGLIIPPRHRAAAAGHGGGIWPSSPSRSAASFSSRSSAAPGPRSW